MVAYNLMLAIFPFAFLVLFVFSQILRINGVEAGIINDLQALFPDAEQDTLDNILGSIRNNSATIGLVAAAWPTVQVVPPYIERSTAIPSGALTVIPRLPGGTKSGIVNVARLVAPTVNAP